MPERRQGVPAQRRRGLGRGLLVELLHRARRVGLDVNVDNPAAARLYAGLGFAITGRRARYEKGLGKPDGPG